MSGASTLEYLKEICRQIDDGTLQQKLRKTAVVTAIPVSMLVAGCTAMEYGAPPSVALYGVPLEEVCHNGYDDDEDGLTDCDDPDCPVNERCFSCHDGLDNDANGQADCSDTSCAGVEGCVGSCDDGSDDDDDGLIDCDDPDCSGSSECP